MTTEQKAYYGSIRGMSEVMLLEKKKEAERFLKEAERFLSESCEELARRQAFEPAELLADRLHKLLHFAAECDYHYSDWPNANGCRYEYRHAAEQLLIRGTDVITAIGIMERLRFGQ